MRLLADENFPGPAVRALRSQGHDVIWVKERMRGAPDLEVLRAAQTEQRILLTCDKDFGELAFGAGLPAACGVVLFRLVGLDPAEDNERMVRALAARDDWAGHFAVVTDARIRLRPLRPPPRAGPTAPPAPA
jgi:predicted nuclease of predicted toxin-antitoxin system